jgi:GTP-binding protein HflX
LPHRLVEAFKATLEESVQADVLLHVIDAAAPDREAHAATTLEVLTEVGAGARPVLTVLNKCDLLDAYSLNEALARYPGAVAVSATTGQGIPALLEALDGLAARGDRQLRLLIPHDRYDIVGKLHAVAGILSEKAEAEGVVLEAIVTERLRSEIEPFILGEI